MQALFLRYCTYGLNIVPIKYNSDIHTPKYNYDVINIVDVTVRRHNFYLVTVFEYT